MASKTYDETTSAKTSAASASDDSGGNGIGASMADAAGTVRGAASDAVAKLPDVAATTRSAIEDANRQMRAGSDEMLTIGTVLSFGFAMGLLLGGASRLLVAGALIPAAMMSLTLLDRTSRTRSGARRLQDA
ncbi:MAG: hypothetical protein QOE66_857 [Chloroflexota bacterium]|jgi:hypothetical protein|nr:hypothetical protein [Chloroflexota bacterium]